MNNYNKPDTPLPIGPSLMLVETFDAINELSNDALMVGCIINFHSDSVNVHAGRRYFSFEEILECKACQASCLEEFPTLTLAPSLLQLIFAR